MIVLYTSLIGKRERERSGTDFSILRKWLKGWKNVKVILSHTTKQLYYKQFLHYFTLDRIIKVHNKSGNGFMQKLFLAGMNEETTSVHINYNHRSRHGGKMYENIDQRWITGSFKMQISMNNVPLYQNKNEQLIQNWQCSGWCMVNTHISE